MNAFYALVNSVWNLKRAGLPLTLALLSSATSLAFLVLSPAASAGSTRYFSIDSAQEFASEESSGAVVLSTGQIVAGPIANRIAIPDAGLAFAAVSHDGSTYIGTGHRGQIYRVRGEQAELFAETGQLLVTSLLVRNGTLYAGTLPEGRVFAVNLASRAVREFVRLEGAAHVWSLALLGETIYASTGPDGKVFAIRPDGQASVYFDSDAEHVLSLAVSGNDLLAGTSDRAILYRITGANRASIVYDFEGNEVSAIDAQHGIIAAIANDMPSPRANLLKNGAAPGNDAPRPGKGRVYRIDADGRVERVLSDEGTHFTAVRVVSADEILVGAGKDGKLHRVSAAPGGAGRRASAIIADVTERQVLAILASGQDAEFVTGDAAAHYRLARGRAEESVWVSKVQDARFAARFGELSWRGAGRVSFETRSGNSEVPGDTWTPWSSPMPSPGPIRSPENRYLQIRAKLAGDARIDAVVAYYAPQNQRAEVTQVGLKTRPASDGSVRDPSTEVELSWDVSNPDEDSMRYRLRYRAEGQEQWRSMFPEETRLTKNQYSWRTSALPDGFYVVEVEASDEPANAEPFILRASAVSEPILVDNHPPLLSNVRVDNGRLRGIAEDGLGPISRVEFAVDGGEFRLAACEDGILDTRREAFAIPVPTLPAGAHILAVRALDAAGNSVSHEVTFNER